MIKACNEIKALANGELPSEEGSPTAIQSGATSSRKKTTQEEIVISMRSMYELVAFLDYSFERAFTVKERCYIDAYRTHVQKVSATLKKLEEMSAPDQLVRKTIKKLEEFQMRLSKIKSSALFLGEMSELHKERLQKQHSIGSDIEDNLQFLKEMIFKEKVENAKIKDKLMSTSHEYDGLFLQAQEFIHNSNDQVKINQLLALLDDEQRDKLIKINNSKQQSMASSLAPRRPVNYTNDSFKKYGNIKVQNFIQSLQKIGLTRQRFAEEIGNYFAFSAIRSQNMIMSVQEKIEAEKKTQIKLRNDLRNSKIKSVRKSLKQFGQGHTQTDKPQVLADLKQNQLYILFLAALNKQRDNIRQRKMFTQFENVRSLKAKPSQLTGPELSSINIASFKVADKRTLLEIFFSDERVQVIIGQLLTKANRSKSPDYPELPMPSATLLAQHNQQAQSYGHIELSGNYGNSHGPVRTQSAVQHSDNRFKVGFRQRPETGKVRLGGQNMYQRLLEEQPKKLMNPTPSALGRSASTTNNTMGGSKWNLRQGANGQSHNNFGTFSQSGASHGQRGHSAVPRPQTSNIYKQQRLTQNRQKSAGQFRPKSGIPNGQQKRLQSGKPLVNQRLDSAHVGQINRDYNITNSSQPQFHYPQGHQGFMMQQNNGSKRQYENLNRLSHQ